MSENIFKDRGTVTISNRGLILTNEFYRKGSFWRQILLNRVQAHHVLSRISNLPKWFHYQGSTDLIPK